jgi:A/G-specific adenine glycosylase
VEGFVTAVIKWEEAHWVPYPWRVNRAPYRVLIAEVLLQRTTRKAVSRVYEGFIAKFPDTYSVYKADTGELEGSLRPIGLYKQRASRLKEIARAVVEGFNGTIPCDYDTLNKLYGVGPYIAGTVLSFGCGVRAPVADSNVLRLLKRAFGVNGVKDALELLWAVVPKEGHEVFNYGLIDLGAYVCTDRGPKCWECPVRPYCKYYANSTASGAR